ADGPPTETALPLDTSSFFPHAHGVRARQEPPRLTEEELDEQDVALPGVGPEPLAMPEGMEEIAEAGPADTGEPIDLAMTRQRNATVLAELARVLQAGAAAPAGEAAAKLLAGLSRRALNEELLRLLRVLTQAAEGASELVVGASTADQAFDRAWRRAGLHSWDTLLVRWHTATTAGVHEDRRGADGGRWAEEQGGIPWREPRGGMGSFRKARSLQRLEAA
ncbi:unnamed protein product, partial [Prorocentrum cordatum]